MTYPLVTHMVKSQDGDRATKYKQATWALHLFLSRVRGGTGPAVVPRGAPIESSFFDLEVSFL